jgi:environmental stress-induced protein Ves
MVLDVSNSIDDSASFGCRNGQNANGNMTSYQRTMLLKQSSPFHFSGDVKTTATLIDEQPLLDFNIMTRRNAFSQETKRLMILPSGSHSRNTGDPRSVELSVDGASFVVIHANSGRVSVTSHTHNTSVGGGDTCVITVDPSVKLPHSWISLRGSNYGCDFIYAVVRPADTNCQR